MPMGKARQRRSLKEVGRRLLLPLWNVRARDALKFRKTASLPIETIFG